MRLITTMNLCPSVANHAEVRQRFVGVGAHMRQDPTGVIAGTVAGGFDPAGEVSFIGALLSDLFRSRRRQ